MKTLAAVLGTTLLAITPALAQPAPETAPSGAPTADAFEKDLAALFSASGLTSQAAATRAKTASPTVRRRIAEVDAAIASAENAELARVPQVGAKLSYTRLSEVDLPPFNFGGMEFANPFPQILNNYGASANIAIALSDYVLRYPAIVQGAKLGLEVARVSRQSAEVTAGQEARIAYYEWVRAKLQVLISKRQLAQVSATLGQVRALAEAQRLSKADLMRVESNEAQAQQIVYQLQNLSDLREEQLRLLIGAEASETLEIGEDIRQALTAPQTAALDAVMADVRTKRLEFQILDKGMAAKDKQREAEKAGEYPRLTAFANADYLRPNQRIVPQVDEFRFTWAAGVQMTWTLNDALVSRSNQRRIAAETAQLRADRENLERGTRIEVLAAQQAVTLAQASLETSAKGLAAAEEGYRVRRELLNAERATAVELVDAETDLTRARIAALNARVDLRVAMTQLEHAVGNDVPAK